MFNKRRKYYLKNLEHFFVEIRKLDFSVSENKRNDDILYIISKMTHGVKFGLVIRNQTYNPIDDELNYTIIFERVDSPSKVLKHSLVYLRDDLLNISGIEYINCSNEFKNIFMKIYSSFLSKVTVKINSNSTKIEKLHFLEEYVNFYNKSIE